MAGEGNKQRVVVIVDPYSSGMYLVQEFAAQQWPMVGIQSSQELAGFWLAQYDSSRFVHTIRHTDLASTLKELEGFEVVSVLPGSEPGVLVAEDLADALKLPGNGSDTKDWRRDKYSQQERLREVGVRAVKQFYSGNLGEILAWREQWGKWPVIVKPAMSGGTDGVYWCHSDEDVRHAHEVECGKRNVNGVVNDKLLVQEYLDGPEFVVDAVSYEGRHLLNGIWKYNKKKDPKTKAITYEYSVMMESTGPEQDQLVSYTFQCLDALSVKFGPSHSEVILTSDGPCLVETGARMHGAKGPKVIELATGLGTHELTVDIAVNGARLFNSLHASGFKYFLKKFAFETDLRNDHAVGRLARSIDIPEVRKLPSIVDVFPNVKVGEELSITRDLATSPGMVMQLHASLDQCYSDITALRELEATILYKVLPHDGLEDGEKSPGTGATCRVMSPQREPQDPPIQLNGDPLLEFELDGLQDGLPQ